MDSKKQKEISDVLQQFNRQVTKLFKIGLSFKVVNFANFYISHNTF